MASGVCGDRTKTGSPPSLLALITSRVKLAGLRRLRLRDGRGRPRPDTQQVSGTSNAPSGAGSQAEIGAGRISDAMLSVGRLASDWLRPFRRAFGRLGLAASESPVEPTAENSKTEASARRGPTLQLPEYGSNFMDKSSKQMVLVLRADSSKVRLRKDDLLLGVDCDDASE